MAATATHRWWCWPPRSAADCFEVGIEAVRLATKYMTPVMLLTDGYIANAAEPWRIPDLDSYVPFPVSFHTDTEGFQPFLRDDDTLARVWAIPGTPRFNAPHRRDRAGL